MRRTPLLSAILLGGLSTMGSTFAQGIPVMNPSNGHYYLLYDAQVSWPAAKAAAEVDIFQGLPGHLVTISDQAELDWILTNIAPARPWIGLSQNRLSPSYSEPAGGFEWVTGEPLQFLNWSPGEPNDTSASAGAEDFVELFGNGEWNDAEEFHAQTTQYLVEWETGGLGTSYCPSNPNSVGLNGSMSALGSALTVDNNLTLTASDLPPSSFGFFIVSQTQGFVANPNGSQGNLCLSGAIGRYVGPGQIMNSGGSGEISLLLDLTQTPQPAGLVSILPAQSWSFQLWHRDQFMGMPASNFTDGLEILFF